MRLLFTTDSKDYGPDDRTYERPSVRGILIRDGKIALVHSLKYDYYKFPGGGFEPGETSEQALIREVAEEAGLTVLPGSIRPYGRVHRVQRRQPGIRFVQENDYYFCEAGPDPVSQNLDDYEADERFTPEWADPARAIAVNRSPGHGPKDPRTLEREARVLEMLMAEGYFRR